MRVLITGITGFIGPFLAARLRADGHAIVGLARTQPPPGLCDSFIAHDLTAGPPPAAALAGVEVIFHLAGRAHAFGDKPAEAERLHRTQQVEATEHLLTAAQAAGVRRLVYFSTIKAMRESTGPAPVDESMPGAPISPYGRAKRLAEQRVLEGGQVPEPVVLRLSMVYGPGDRGNLQRLSRSIAAGRFPPLPRVANCRSMVHAADVAQAATLAATAPAAPGNIYLVTDGQTYAVGEIIERLYRLHGRRPPRLTIPLPLFRLAASAGDLGEKLLRRPLPFSSAVYQRLFGHAHYSSARLQLELGFRPTHTLWDFFENCV